MARMHRRNLCSQCFDIIANLLRRHVPDWRFSRMFPARSSKGFAISEQCHRSLGDSLRAHITETRPFSKRSTRSCSAQPLQSIKSIPSSSFTP